MSISTGKAKWTGTLKDGKGIMNFSDYEGSYTFASRFESGEGINPEQLTGAALAGCYSMFLSALISGEKLDPESIDTTAKVNLSKDDTGPFIDQIELECQVKCSGLSQDKFEELSKAAKEKCPISRLYSGTNIVLKASLA